MALEILYLAWNRLEFTKFSFAKLLENTDWEIVDRLVIYDDGSTDGTREYLDEAISQCPVEHELRHLGLGSPVATMRHFIENSQAELMLKTDSDIIWPPGYLPTMIGVIERNYGLELLGAEAGRTGLPDWRDFWDGEYRYELASHIGGVGLMKVDAFRSRPSLLPDGRYGLTEWQVQYRPGRGWISPDLLICDLSRVPIEPWRSLTAEYIDLGWQRDWGFYDERHPQPWEWFS